MDFQSDAIFEELQEIDPSQELLEYYDKIIGGMNALAQAPDEFRKPRERAIPSESLTAQVFRPVPLLENTETISAGMNYYFGFEVPSGSAVFLGPPRETFTYTVMKHIGDRKVTIEGCSGIKMHTQRPIYFKHPTRGNCRYFVNWLIYKYPVENEPMQGRVERCATEILRTIDIEDEGNHKADWFTGFTIDYSFADNGREPRTGGR